MQERSSQPLAKTVKQDSMATHEIAESNVCNAFSACGGNVVVMAVGQIAVTMQEIKS